MKFRSTASPAVLKSGKEDIHCLTLLYCSRYVRTSGGCAEEVVHARNVIAFFVWAWPSGFCCFPW